MHKIAREPDFRNVEFATVDFDRSEDLVKSRQVDRLPTLEIYRGQDLKQRWSGANTKKFLERLESENEVAQEVMSGWVHVGFGRWSIACSREPSYSHDTLKAGNGEGF